MCGIAGFVSRKFSGNHLRQMTDCLQKRGPDAEGWFVDEEAGLGLGHRRLSVIDLSAAANQPMWSADRRYCIIFNGEIYNYREVAIKYDIRQRTSSDTEVIVESFAKAGINCLQDFNGMFTIAIWDKQQKKLYLVRDRFGVKPLVYYWNGKDLAFASQLKAIMNLPIEKVLNKTALQDYLFLEYIPAPATILENIYKLPNGHYMIVEDGKIDIRCYYSFRDKVQPRPVPVRDDKQEQEEFRELLSSSVRYRQISDVPIGAFLSGGTDSSLICALMQQQNQNPVNTFTIGFDVAQFDETKEAAQVASILKTNHAEFRLTDEDSIGIVKNLPDYFDEPFAVPSMIPSYLVCHEARKLVTVAMAGDGGDELFMGYGYYQLYKKIKRLYRVDAGIGRHLLAGLFNNMSPRYQRAARMMRLPSDDLFVHLWSEDQYMFSEKEVRKLMHSDYSNHSVRDAWRKIDAMDLHDYEKISLLDIDQYLAHNLLYKMDAASMANSLEVRNPYLDYRLMEYSFNLPLSSKIRNGTQKYLMKELLRQYIPDHMVFRRKWGFPAPVGDWLDKKLAYLLDSLLNERLLQRQGIFDAKEVRRYVDAFRAGKKFHYKRLWAIIFFQMWYARYMENK
jgi:asparagine synthase (glutamine-hydrolysing)